MSKQYLLILLVFVLFTLTGCAKSYTFEIPKEELQKKLEEKFPLNPGKQDKEKSPVDLTLSEPIVILEEGRNQIGLKVNVVAEPVLPEGGPLPDGPPKTQALPIPKPEAKTPSLPGPGKAPGPPGPKPGKNPPAIANALPSKAPTPPPLPKPRFNGTVTVFVDIGYDSNAKALNLSNPKITELKIEKIPEPLTKPLTQMAEKTMGEKFAEKPIPLENKTALDKVVNAVLKSVTVKNGKLLVEIGW